MQSSEAPLSDGSRAAMNVYNLLEKTERQLSMLGRMLNTVSELASDNKSISEGTEAPPELKKKAADTAERILHQIDNLVEDMPRWSSDPTEAERHYNALIHAAAQASDASAFKARVESLPSSRLSPHLHEYAEGRWGAYLVQRGSARLLGSGSSPQEALNDFDVNFIEGEKKVPEKARRAKKKPLKSPDGPKSNRSDGPA